MTGPEPTTTGPEPTTTGPEPTTTGPAPATAGPEPNRPAGGPNSAQLLLDLVNETLDPGYAAAARRRVADAPVRWWERPAVAFGCLLIGVLLVVAYLDAHRDAPETKRVHDGLVDRVRAAQSDAASLADAVSSEQSELGREQDRVLPTTGALVRLREQEQQAAGEVAVDGPGLRVTLTEPDPPSSTASAGRGGSVPIEQANILTDRDVRSVVNQLWSDGAEAIAVNGIRLGPGTAIRFAGQAVLVDFQPITSPYEIEAVGDSDELATDFAQSAAASRYQTLVSADGIGFDVTDTGDLSLPAAAPEPPRYASPLPTPSPTPAPTRSRR